MDEVRPFHSFLPEIINLSTMLSSAHMLCRCPFCIKAKKELTTMNVKFLPVELDTMGDGNALRYELAKVSPATCTSCCSALGLHQYSGMTWGWMASAVVGR